MSDGSKYVGEFQKGEIQGKGEFKWADGSSYYGDWYKSCMHGIGTYNWDQKVYKGKRTNYVKGSSKRIRNTATEQLHTRTEVPMKENLSMTGDMGKGR